MNGKDEDGLIAELERLDRFFDGEEAGEIPLEVLRARGVVIPEDEAQLDDASLHAKLREVLDALLDLGMIVEDTDHLSDRECYRWLVAEVLREETILSESGAWHISPIGGGSEEDNEIYLRYYADEDIRQDWQREFGGELPPHEPLPYDRDRLLGENAGG